jgi:hypothetical protein
VGVCVIPISSWILYIGWFTCPVHDVSGVGWYILYFKCNTKSWGSKLGLLTVHGLAIRTPFWPMNDCCYTNNSRCSTSLVAVLHRARSHRTHAYALLMERMNTVGVGVKSSHAHLPSSPSPPPPPPLVKNSNQLRRRRARRNNIQNTDDISWEWVKPCIGDVGGRQTGGGRTRVHSFLDPTAPLVLD